MSIVTHPVSGYIGHVPVSAHCSAMHALRRGRAVPVSAPRPRRAGATRACAPRGLQLNFKLAATSGLEVCRSTVRRH
eukprot:SAG11_NODE_1846_length_4172_cov_3.188313_9_plen_77_part_00